MQLRLRRNERYAFLVLLPILLLIAIFVYYPAISTFIDSLWSKNLSLPGAEKFVFLNNYLRLLEDSEFWQVLGRSFIVVIFVLPLEVILGLGIALLLNQHFPGRGIVRVLVILPWMLPPVVNGFLWGWVLNGDYGAFNGLLYQFGLIDEYQFWLKGQWQLIFWITVVQTWTRFAFPMIIMLAGLQSIPSELYEAAEIDGGNVLARFRYITFPLLLPAIAVSLTVEFISAFQIFDVIWTLTAGGSAGNVINPFTKTLMIFNYQLVFRDLRIGMGAALSYLILILSLVVGLFFVRNLYDQAVET
jgi:multiple sugar transport system permease protein